MGDIYELRIYTLASAEAQKAYGEHYYPKHKESMKKLLGITVHGFWNADGYQFYVLLSYPEGSDVDALRQKYREHPEAAANMPGFDPAVILGVSTTMLSAVAASPLT